MLGLAGVTLLTFICLGYTCCIQGSGPIAHLTVVYRAKEYFDGASVHENYGDLTRTHFSSLKSGSIYPDALSGCAGGKYKSIAEDTHDGGFLNATVNYLRSKYAPPWSEEARNLIMFTFGVLSNQVSTSLWRGTGVEPGFLQTLANVNFHGLLENATDAAALGADSVILYKSNTDYYLKENENWFFPTEDLFNIYQDLYGTVRITKDAIDNCTSLLGIREFIELLYASEIYPEVAEISPFLADQLQNYVHGGINDMTAWTQRKWMDAIVLLEKGTKACTIPRNPLLINCTGQSSRSTNRGEQSIAKREGRTLAQPKSAEDSKLFYTNHTFSDLGWSLVAQDMDGDGNDDVIVGAPGYSVHGDYQRGKVFILYYLFENCIMGTFTVFKKLKPSTPYWFMFQSKDKYNIVFVLSTDYAIRTDINRFWQQVETMNSTNRSSIDGPSQAQSRFGSSVAVVDINLDGVPDLAVGAPSYGNTSPLHNNGIVYIYYGTSNHYPVKSPPNVTVTCQMPQCQLGFSLTTTDYDDDGHVDLVLGSPFYKNQSGIVSGLAASTKYTGHITIAFETLIQQWSLSSSQEYSWFGYSVKARDGVLMISQPYFRKCGRGDCQMSQNDTQGIGAVNVYNLANKVKLANLKITGMKEFDQAGYSSDLGYPYGEDSLILAVGVPGADVYGRFYGIPFHLRQAGTVIVYAVTSTGQINQVANFDGDRAYGRFGAFVKVDDVNGDGVDDLIISSVERSVHVIPYRRDGTDMDGKTYVYYGGPYFPMGNVTHSIFCKEKAIPCPQQLANLTTSHTVIGCRYGDHVAVAKAKRATSIVSSALYWNNVYAFEDASGVVVNTMNHTIGKTKGERHHTPGDMASTDIAL